MAVEREIVELIEGVVRERFADTPIESVRIREDTDYDGERVFRVTVVFNKRGGLDSKKTSTIARHLRHKLLAREESAFPIFAFVSKADASGLKPEAA